MLFHNIFHVFRHLNIQNLAILALRFDPVLRNSLSLCTPCTMMWHGFVQKHDRYMHCAFIGCCVPGPSTTPADPILVTLVPVEDCHSITKHIR